MCSQKYYVKILLQPALTFESILFKVIQGQARNKQTLRRTIYRVRQNKTFSSENVQDS